MSVSRRCFLKGSFGASALVAMGPTVPAFLSRTAHAADPSRAEGNSVLVVLQLTGGNDGLNTVIPFEDDAYARGRPTLRLKGSEVHKIGDDLGFHPEMKGFARLFKEGQLMVVQGVAYPAPNRNHPTALLNYQTAQPNEPNRQTGWLGRAVDLAVGEGTSRVPGVFVGPIAQPFTLNAAHAVVPTVRTLSEVLPEGDRAALSERRALAEALPSGANPLLDFVRRTTVDAADTVESLRSAVRDSRADYPPFGLARDLRTVAQLIRADVGFRIVHAELGGGGLGGFDNHAGQKDNHAALLRQMSESVAAFVDDLARDKTLDRVLLMTFSEFGRTVVENGRRGTDHGIAQPIFLVGGRLKGGLVGKHPSVSDLDANALKWHTDFRRIYATALTGWLGFDHRAVLEGSFEPMDLLET